MSERRMTGRVWEIVESGRDADKASAAFDLFILASIVVSVVGLVLGTVERYDARAHELFVAIEVVTVGIFTVEWLLRAWGCVDDPSGRYSHPLWGRMRYAVSPMALVDLLAILPFYIVLVVPIAGLDLRFLRVVRLAARVARLGRYSTTISILGRVLRNTRGELVAVFGVMALLLLIASSLMYFAENKAQPETFASIPASMWWAIITITTVGYGDAIPVTTFGRVLTASLAVLGIGLIALPAGILGNGFVEETRRSRESAAGLCPHCGQPMNAAAPRD